MFTLLAFLSPRTNLAISLFIPLANIVLGGGGGGGGGLKAIFCSQILLDMNIMNGYHTLLVMLGLPVFSEITVLISPEANGLH